MIGVNNFLFNIPAERTHEEYKSLIGLINSKLSFNKIYLLELLPIGYNSFFVDRDEINLLIKGFNNHIRTLVKKDRTGKIYFVPLFSQFKDKNDQLKSAYTNDGIHLNVKGVKLLKENILSFLFDARK